MTPVRQSKATQLQNKADRAERKARTIRQLRTRPQSKYAVPRKPQEGRWGSSSRD